MLQRNWKDLIKPKRLEVEEKSLASNYGKFVAEPLERGFGITVGNSLRRILLSSLQGAAIASVLLSLEASVPTMPRIIASTTTMRITWRLLIPMARRTPSPTAHGQAMVRLSRRYIQTT